MIIAVKELRKRKRRCERLLRRGKTRGKEEKEVRTIVKMVGKKRKKI